MKTAQADIDDDGNLSIEFGGEWEGACCGPEEKALLAELERLGVRMDLESVSCRLPDDDRKAAVREGDCVTIRKGAER